MLYPSANISLFFCTANEQLFPTLAVSTTDTVITHIHSNHRLLCNCLPLQLRAARYELYDVFFSLSAGERMQLISWDRELARERELRRQVTFCKALVELKKIVYISPTGSKTTQKYHYYVTVIHFLSLTVKNIALHYASSTVRASQGNNLTHSFTMSIVDGDDTDCS